MAGWRPFDKRLKLPNDFDYISGESLRSGGCTTTDYRSIDVRRWEREGLLEPGRSFSWSWTRDGERQASIDVEAQNGAVILSYSHWRGDSEKKTLRYAVEIQETRCHFGGSRPWFLCPIRGCGRRTAILYCAGLFACRRCLNLAYDCQREPTHYRHLHKAQAILVRLGGSGSMADPFPDKPKGMHWRTYWNLARRYEEADALAIPPWLMGMIES